MKVKELRRILNGLHPEMEIYVDSGFDGLEDAPAGYSSIILPVSKAKTKLQRTVKGRKLVQGRPFRDEKAKLALIIE